MIRFLAILLLSFNAYADFTGKVVGVSDGDIIAVLSSSRKQHKICLSDIYAPEKALAFGNKSKQRFTLRISR